jgi:sigma-B regulation protein RsbU (phosphoserine phosphatase)
MVAESGYSPAETLKRVNHLLLQDFPTAKFVTIVYAVFDPKNSTVVFARAGHCYPIFVDSSDVHFLRTEARLPLGIREVSFSEATVRMIPGSRLLFYSDGVTEAMK